MKRKILILVTALSLIIGALPVYAQGEINANTVSEAEQAELMEWKTDKDTGLDYYENGDGTVMIGGCDENAAGELVIPSEINGMAVVTINKVAFYGCTGLTGVTIPDSVKIIDSMAFRGCTSLKNIKISDSVEYIAELAFENTAYYNDESNWDNGVLYVGKHLVEAKDDISGKYDVRENTRSISGLAFSDCQSLTSITLPDSVTYIGDHAFNGCTSLKSITSPKSINYLGAAAFANCTSLKNVEIPDLITYLFPWTYSDCKSLTSVTIPDRMEIIGVESFSECTGLTNIIIPKTVKTIAERAFSGCTALTDVYYTGTEAEWSAIEMIEDGNDAILNAAIHYNTVLVPTEVIPAPAITVSAPAVGADGKSEVEVVVPALEKNYANAVVYAVTDGDIVSQTALVNGGETKLTVPANGTDTVRVFIWNKSMQPITTVYSESIK